MAKDPKVERLRNAPLFAGCSDKALRTLASAVDTVDVSAGYTIMREGLPNTSAYVVDEGVAEVHLGDKVVAEIPAGHIIGEIALLTREPSTATVVAKTDMVLTLIPHNRFDQIMTDAPEIVMEIARELARRLQATDEKLH